MDEGKAADEASSSDQLAKDLAARKRTLEQWSTTAYGEVRPDPTPCSGG